MKLSIELDSDFDGIPEARRAIECIGLTFNVRGRVYIGAPPATESTGPDPEPSREERLAVMAEAYRTGQVPPLPTPYPLSCGSDAVDPMPEHGTDLDADGLPHDARIHAPGKVRNADGRWRAKRNVDDATREKVTAELRAIMAASADVAARLSGTTAGLLTSAVATLSAPELPLADATVATGFTDPVRDASSGPCNLGVGCDEAGVCYAEAMGAPDRCPHTPVGLSDTTAGVADRLSTRIDQMLDGAAPPPPSHLSTDVAAPPVTATGRVPASEPNLQNTPTSTDDSRRVRDAFAPPPPSPPTLVVIPPPPPPAAVAALFAPEAPAQGFGEFVDWLGDELSRGSVTDAMWQAVLGDLGLPGIAALDHRPDLVATARQRIEALRDAGGAA